MECKPKPYTLFEHRHRFAVWAAARAAQRGFTSIKNLRFALENTDIKEFSWNPISLQTDESTFKTKHRIWCQSICDTLKEIRVQNVTFGRAAKLVAVYLKSMMLTPANSKYSLAKVIHPPIDRILLHTLARQPDIDKNTRNTFKAINWTALDEKGYRALVKKLRKIPKPNAPFWTLEKYWDPTADR